MGPVSVGLKSHPVLRPGKDYPKGWGEPKWPPHAFKPSLTERLLGAASAVWVAFVDAWRKAL